MENAKHENEYSLVWFLMNTIEKVLAYMVIDQILRENLLFFTAKAYTA